MFVASLEPFTQTSIDFLQQIFNDNDTFIALTFDSFVALHSNSDCTAQNFDCALTISKTELKTQICFDLCIFYLHIKKYDLARENAIACRNNLAELKKEYRAKQMQEFLFCTLNEDELYGCMLACGVADQKEDLLHSMNQSILQQYLNITEILKEDNVKMKIPLVNRRILELDIEGGLTNRQSNLPKTLLVQVAALNVIKSIFEENDLFSFNDFLQKFKSQNGLNVLVDYTTAMLPISDPVRLIKLKQFYLNILTITTDIKHDVEIIRRTNLFTTDELNDLKNQRAMDEIVLQSIATAADWKMIDSKRKQNIT